MRRPAHLYTAFAGIILLVQGTFTLAFRLMPALDRAFPQLLAVTQMVPVHSGLHILTGLIALGVLFWGGDRGVLWFALGFGLFYMGLALVGMISGQPTIFRLQPFDHPFHTLLGGLGLGSAALHHYHSNSGKRATL